MKRMVTPVIVALLVCCLGGPAVRAADLYVAKNGNDSWTGTSLKPYLTIKKALSVATSGTVVHVRTGTYAESYIQVPSNITVKSEDGLYTAKVYSGGSTAFRLENGVTGAVVDGFEVYADYSGGGGYYDGLLRVYNCSNCTFRNMLVHDAPRDADVIKVGGTGAATTNTLIENCIVYNPSPRNGDLTGASGYQECIDCYPPDGVVIRGCWLYHTPDKKGDVLTFCKGGSKNITWENNIFGPRYGDPYGNAATMAGGPSPAIYPACTNFIARNNLFLNTNGDGAFAILGVRNCEFYNNVIWNYAGTRAAIEFFTALVGGGNNENCRVYNNIIMKTNGMPAFADRGIWTSDGTYIPTVFYHDYNIYYQVPNGGDVNIATETHSLFNIDPRLVSPSGPVLGTDTWAGIVARFRLQATSPAIDAGLNLGSLVAFDLYGVARPMRTAYDIGPYEIPWVGDTNKDNHVDAFDLLAMAGGWATHTGDAGFNAACDVNGDGGVDVVDLLLLADNWGR